MQDSRALNLLYIETVSDIQKDWIVATHDIKDQLRILQERGKKKEVLENLTKILIEFKKKKIFCSSTWNLLNVCPHTDF